MNNVIPSKEREKRWKKLRKELETNKLDALLVPLGINFYYLFGKQNMPTERIIAGVIPVDDEPFIFAPAFEKSNMEISTGIDDIVIWEETDNAYSILANELTSRGIGKNIGVDPKLWIVEVEKITLHSEAKLRSAGNIMDNLRLIKSEWELKQLRKATKLTAEGILNALPQLKYGDTEIEFSKIIEKELNVLSGNPLMFGAIQFGENTAIPHGKPTNRKLKNDEVVLIDAGTHVNGYQGDITISVPYGKPKDFEKIYEIVFEANRKAFDADKEGITGAELDGIARKYISSQGYGEFFTHRLGHGIGIEVHEAPYIVGTNNIPLKEGNCHTIEPGIYIPDKFGIRIEDDVVVKKGDAELLFNTPRHNFSIFN